MNNNTHCQVGACTAPVIARGLCRKHYSRRHYILNRAVYIERAKRWQAENRKFIFRKDEMV